MEEKELFLLKKNIQYSYIFLLDTEGNPYSSDDFDAAIILFHDMEKRWVGYVEKAIYGHMVRLSTLFLVFNANYSGHPPTLYETMLYLDDDAVVRKQYCTKEEAQAGHAEAVERLENILSHAHAMYNQDSIMACLD